jgi:hypothetical protein
MGATQIYASVLPEDIQRQVAGLWGGPPTARRR